MGEGEQTSPMVEALAESKVVRAVVGAVENAQNRNSEYWNIRKTIQDRLKWHGGGVYRHHVQNMDLVINTLYNRKDSGFISKTAAFGMKVAARLEGAGLAVTSGTADILYNTLSWPGRKILPIPKDIFKRMALGISTGRALGHGAVGGAIGAEMGVVNLVRGGASAILTAPEVGARMLKNRVDAVVNQIKNPQGPEFRASKLGGKK